MSDQTRTPQARARARELRIARELKRATIRPVSPAFSRVVK